MLPKYIRRICVGLIILGNILLWMIPSRVVELIARYQTTLLGRYSMTRFNELVFLLLISWIFIYLLLANRENFKKCFFKVITMLLVFITCILLVDFAARFVMTPRYISTRQVYHRQPGKYHKVTIKDIPKALRTYPQPPPGYPPVECTLTIDKRGFRNKTSFDKYDVVTLGDSFTEGFYVSDEHPWPVVFADKSKLSVCNLGMSGTDPFDYLQALEIFGLKLSPGIVICMLTEVSDFRAKRIPEDRLSKSSLKRSVLSHRKDMRPRSISFAKRVDVYFKSSPLWAMYKNACIKYLSGINAHGYVKDIEILSWLPVAVPEGVNVKYYSFTPSRVLSLYKSKDEFVKSEGWNSTAYAIKEMQRICGDANIRLIVAYAPNKVHVVLPVVKYRLPKDKILSFTALRSKKKLPPAQEFIDKLFRSLDVQEAVVSKFCEQNSIEFITITQALREKVSQGQQVYFTYDTHWTPLGHQVVAEIILRYWQQHKDLFKTQEKVESARN